MAPLRKRTFAIGWWLYSVERKSLMTDSTLASSLSLVLDAEHDRSVSLADRRVHHNKPQQAAASQQAHKQLMHSSTRAHQ